LRLFGSVDRRKPNAPVTHESDDVTGWSDSRIVAVPHKLWRSAASGYRPDLHSRLYRTFGRIWRNVRGLIRTVIAAPHVHDGFPVVRERKLRQLLPIILRIRRHPSRGEFRSFSDINISDATLIERPGDCRSRRRC